MYRKQGRAVELGTSTTTQNCEAEQQNEFFGNTDTFSHVTTITSELDIVDLFSVGANKDIEKKKQQNPSYTRSGFTDHKAKSYVYGPI